MWSVSAKTSIPIITRKCKWEHEPSLICAHPQPFVPWRSPWWQHVTGLFKKRKGTRTSFFKLEDEWRRRAALQVKRNTVITAISKREVCKHDKRALKSLLWKIKLKMHTVSVMCERNTSEQCASVWTENYSLNSSIWQKLKLHALEIKADKILGLIALLHLDAFARKRNIRVKPKMQKNTMMKS